MCGTIMIPAKKLDPSISTVSFDHENLELPKNFDARKQWDHCPSLSVILGIFRSCNSINRHSIFVQMGLCQVPLHFASARLEN